MLPKSILSLRASYGCYWGKCTFCELYYLDKNYFFIRKVDDLIEEIKFYIKTYNINTFYFVDYGLPPAYLDEFATKIINQKINISFMMDNRLEDAFDKSLLEKLYKAGLRICAWGLESASPKILEKMNKGININTAQEILKTAHSIGIKNIVYTIYDFPEETIDDFNLTYNFIKENINFIENHVANRFVLPTFSYINSHPEEFGLNKKLIEQVLSNHKDFDRLNAQWLNIKTKPEVQDKILELQRLIIQK